jgi:hypothetical protein
MRVRPTVGMQGAHEASAGLLVIAPDGLTFCGRLYLLGLFCPVSLLL